RDLMGRPAGDSSAVVRARVQRARELQRERYVRVPGVRCNAQLRGPTLREMVFLTDSAARRLGEYLDKNSFSARTHDRLLKLARTIADLAGSEQVRSAHIDDAAQWRCLDKPITGRRA